tara:strand:- start:303 stop:467 length:165 start_codon:yes stop_codon:yes gene_type:complete
LNNEMVQEKDLLSLANYLQDHGLQMIRDLIPEGKLGIRKLKEIDEILEVLLRFQ